MKFSCLVSQKAPGSDIETPEKYLTIRADGGENVLQLLSYAAQTEREFIRQRQAEGIAAAKAKGVKFGRRPMERPPELETVHNKWKEGQLSARKAALQLGITHRTFLAWATEEISD